jgi:hypothetical protein
MTQKILLDRDYLPYGLMVAAERDDPNVKPEFKFGFNATVSSTGETIWAQGGNYTWQAAAATISVTSSSTDDDSTPTPGTGALTVVVEGLDANYAEQSETVTLNGTTVVNTDNTYLRVHRMYVATAGTGLTNAGVIYAATSGDTYTTPGVPNTATKIVSTIAAGEGQTLQAFYTIPAGYTGYLTDVMAGSVEANNATTIDVRKREVGGAFRTRHKFVVFKSTTQLHYDVPLVLPEKTDIEIKGTSAAGTPDVDASFNLLLVAN